jgi:sterol desaturase/sphingolipid hydroxylase (fatty acid hydroxylase superfamily)
VAFINYIEEYRIYIIATFFALIFIWENILPQRRFAKLFKHNLFNFGIGAVNLLLTFFGGLYFAKYLDWFQLNGIGLLFNIFPAFAFALSLIIADILMYWWHRFNHTIPFLWRFHSFHHLDSEMNATTAIRFHAVELFFSFIFRMVFYPIFGISNSAVLVFSTIHFSMIIFHHSNIYLHEKIDKIVRLFIASPGMHRIHHSNKWQETNSNYTSILSCWDWIFGSYVRKPGEEIVFGVPTTPIAPRKD